MDEGIKRDLDKVFEAFYEGLNEVADKVRSGASTDAIANEIAKLAADFCRRWPICRAAHDLDPPAENAYQKTAGRPGVE